MDKVFFLKKVVEPNHNTMKMNPIIMVMQLEMNKFTLQQKALGIIFRIKVYSNQVYMEHLGNCTSETGKF